MTKFRKEGLAAELRSFSRLTVRLEYALPSAPRRIVVSTGTKNLQEQLFFKDVPFLQQHFARPLKVCYMKGRNNCG
jgi:Rad3-related DNA helicase